VEDDDDIAALLRSICRMRAIRLSMKRTAPRPCAAGKELWDAVILDLMLPGVDGLEICRRIRQMTRYLPVIIISARASETHRVLGWRWARMIIWPSRFRFSN
jgi:DNA-binding response OmpR family regulator